MDRNLPRHLPPLRIGRPGARVSRFRARIPAQHFPRRAGGTRHSRACCCWRRGARSASPRPGRSAARIPDWPRAWPRALAAGIVSQQFTVFTIPTAVIFFATIALAAGLAYGDAGSGPPLPVRPAPALLRGAHRVRRSRARAGAARSQRRPSERAPPRITRRPAKPAICGIRAPCSTPRKRRPTSAIAWRRFIVRPLRGRARHAHRGRSVQRLVQPLFHRAAQNNAAATEQCLRAAIAAHPDVVQTTLDAGPGAEPGRAQRRGAARSRAGRRSGWRETSRSGTNASGAKRTVAEVNSAAKGWSRSGCASRIGHRGNRVKQNFPKVALLAAAIVAAASAQTPSGKSLGSIYGSSLASGLAAADSIPPTIDAGGVVSGASFQAGIVPGSWLTIKGTNLSPVARTHGTRQSWTVNSPLRSMA